MGTGYPPPTFPPLHSHILHPHFARVPRMFQDDSSIRDISKCLQLSIPLAGRPPPPLLLLLLPLHCPLLLLRPRSPPPFRGVRTHPILENCLWPMQIPADALHDGCQRVEARPPETPVERLRTGGAHLSNFYHFYNYIEKFFFERRRVPNLNVLLRKRTTWPLLEPGVFVYVVCHSLFFPPPSLGRLFDSAPFF